MVDVGFYGEDVVSVKREQEYKNQVRIYLTDGTEILVFDPKGIIKTE